MSQDSYEDSMFEEGMIRYTSWHNPTESDVKIEYLVETPKPSFPNKPSTFKQKTGKQIFKVPAGGTAQLDSTYDSAIHTVRDGQIIGGLAPQLRHMGIEDHPKIHPALNAERVKAKEARDEAVRLMSELEAMKEALLIAQGQAMKTATEEAKILANHKLAESKAQPKK